MKWRIAIAVVAFTLFGWAGWEIWAGPAVKQPIEFPHKTHVDLNLQCTSCHEGAEKDAVAGRPATALCLTCHSGSDGTPEIRKVQAFEKSGSEIPWQRVWRLPPHVFFPHRTHVVAAKLACQTCHGPMETLVRPPSRPLKRLAMSDCIGCHETQGRPHERTTGPVMMVASRPLATDCASCHR